MTLALVVVTDSRSQQRDHVFPTFRKDARFNPHWWLDGSAKSPVSYCGFWDGDEEIGRAKILPNAGTYDGYVTWSCPRGGVIEIDLVEVRVDLRGRGYGRKIVEQIGVHYGRPLAAMSLDEHSDRFWRSLRWTEHMHPDGDRYRTLFTSA